MKPPLRPLACLTFVLSSPYLGAEEPAVPQEPICESPAEGALCTRFDPESNPLWFRRGTGGKLLPLSPTPETSMAQVTGLWTSPDRHRLAVMSVGEGHPMLDIFDLPTLLAGSATPPIYTLNPYPHLVDVEKWIAPDLLALGIQRLLDDAPLPPGAPSCPTDRYGLRVPEMRLECLDDRGR